MKSRRVDLFDSTYGNFSDRVHAAIRAATFGADIGQNSWTTEDEYDRFIAWLGLGSGHHALEVASGSGGPALHLARGTQCRVTGIDANEIGVAAATAMAIQAGLADRVNFRAGDANAALRFEGDSFDAREHHKDALVGIEGEERFAGLQAFFAMVHRLTRERRLSRIVYRVEKPEL